MKTMNKLGGLLLIGLAGSIYANDSVSFERPPTDNELVAKAIVVTNQNTQTNAAQISELQKNISLLNMRIQLLENKKDAQDKPTTQDDLNTTNASIVNVKDFAYLRSDLEGNNKIEIPLGTRLKVDNCDISTDKHKTVWCYTPSFKGGYVLKKLVKQD